MINQLISFHNSKIICCHQIFFKVVRFTHVQHSQSVRRASCILHHLSISFICSSFICSYPFTHLNLILKFTCIYYYILFFNTIFLEFIWWLTPPLTRDEYCIIYTTHNQTMIDVHMEE